MWGGLVRRLTIALRPNFRTFGAAWLTLLFLRTLRLLFFIRVIAFLCSEQIFNNCITSFTDSFGIPDQILLQILQQGGKRGKNIRLKAIVHARWWPTAPVMIAMPVLMMIVITRHRSMAIWSTMTVIPVHCKAMDEHYIPKQNRHKTHTHIISDDTIQAKDIHKFCLAKLSCTEVRS